MALCLKHSVLTLYHPGNVLIQTMLINCEFYWYKLYYIPLLYVENGAPTSRVYASSIVLQMSKDIQKEWRFAALQWHNVTTKHPEYP
jgi:hypothetical protein